MMLKSAETQKAFSQRLGQHPGLNTGHTTEKVSVRRNSQQTTTADPTESVQSLKQELEFVRHEHGRLQQAVYEAAQIQRRLCAPRELEWGEFEIAGESFPVRHLSGDFFKVLELDSVLGLALGDIAGKGLSAGIWQAHLLDLIQRCARNSVHPAEVVASVNRELCLDQNEPPITALFFARLDPERNELTYSNAGLPAPLVLRQDKSVERLDAGGPMLGALEEVQYDSGSIRLNPGDMLLAYSDGLTECCNSHEQEFEVERLSAAAKSFSGATANQVLFSTLATVLDFAEACPPSDDLTLLVIRRRETIHRSHAPDGKKNFSASRSRLSSTERSKQVTSRLEVTKNN